MHIVASVAHFQFCPQCAKPLTLRDAGGRSRPACPEASCGFVHWGNPTPVVGAIIERDGHVLLARAKPWPEKMFALVTGFLEAAESPEAAVCREVKEELGLQSRVVSLVGLYPFELRNELLIIDHLIAEPGEVVLGDELAAYKSVPIEKLRAWPIGTGPAVQQWLDARRLSGS